MNLEDIKLNKDIVNMVSHIKRKGLDDKYNIDDISKALIELYDNRNIVMEQNYKLKSSLQNHLILVQKNTDLRKQINEAIHNNKDFINKQVNKKLEKEIKHIEFDIRMKCNTDNNRLAKENLYLNDEVTKLKHNLDVWKAKFTEQASANAKLINKYINKE